MPKSFSNSEPEKDDKPLSDSGNNHNLGAKTVSGGIIVFGAMVVQRLIGLVILAVMARLLSPQEYGLLGMVFALTAFLQIFADMGLPLATVQKDHLTQPQISTIFWLNLFFGIVLGLATALAAPLLAQFYREPILKSVTLLCAINFPLVALGAQHGALLQRRMAFGRLAIAEIAGLVAGGTVGIIAALRGYGVFALVAQQLAGYAVTVVCNWLLAGWLPGMPARKCGVRSMITFGGYLTAFNFVNYFARNLDKIFLGRFCGAAPLGLYNRGYALMMFPITMVSSPINRVMIPALSRIQHDLPRMRVVYIETLKMIGFVSFPIMAWLMVCGSDVIIVVYGQKWTAAAPIFIILCLVGVWQGIYNATAQVFLATGRTDKQFKVGLVMALVLAIAFTLGIRGGAKGIAASYAAAFSLAILPYLAYTYSTVGLRMIVVLRNLWPSFMAAAAMAPFLWVFQKLVGWWTPLPRLCCSFGVAVPLYFLFSAVVNRVFLVELYRRIATHLPFSVGRFFCKATTRKRTT